MTDSNNQDQLPTGSSPISTDEMLQVIGELYLQVVIQRRTIQRIQLESRSLLRSDTTTPA